MRYRTPTQDGTVLADPPHEEIGSLILENRSILNSEKVAIDGTPLGEFRRQAIEEVVEAARQYLRDAGEPLPEYAAGPMLLSGHQPELTHVGVLVKTFALNGMARRHGLSPLNLIVDNDTAKTTSMRLAVLSEPHCEAPKPLIPELVHLLSLPYDRFEGEVPFEERAIVDGELFQSVLERAMPYTRAWGFSPILPEFWEEMLRQYRRTPILGEIVSATRRAWERRWGCHNLEIPLSRLCATNAFQRFVRHVVRDLPRFHTIYNECVAEYRHRNGLRSRNHPVPDLQRDGDILEAPFWNVRRGEVKRGRLLVRPGEVVGGPNLRSRALTTTMFARICLSDGFIHGIGGAKYDEVTDAIINRWLGISAPRIIVLTATLRLPLPHFPTTIDDLHTAQRNVRDLEWNPQRHLAESDAARPMVQNLLEEKQRLLLDTLDDKAERKARFRRLCELTEQLRPFVAQQVKQVTRELEKRRRETLANGSLLRRDFPWCLFPEPVIREFCQRLLR